MKLKHALFSTLVVMAIASCGGGSNSTPDVDDVPADGIDGASDTDSIDTGDEDSSESDTGNGTDTDAIDTVDSDTDSDGSSDSEGQTEMSGNVECTTSIRGQSQSTAQILESLVSLQNQSAHAGVCLEALPFNSVVQPAEIAEAVVNGLLDMGLVSSSSLSTYNPGFDVFELPFLFSDAEDAGSFQNSVEGQNILSTLLDVNIVAPAYINAGFVQFSTNTPVIQPGDMLNKKFRQSRFTAPAEAFHDELGAFGLRLAFSEVSAALITGVIDGVETTISSAAVIFQDDQVADALDGITVSNHIIDTHVLIINSSIWNSLDTASKENIQLAALDLNRQIAQEEADRLDDLMVSGVTVRRLTSEQRDLWIEAANPVILQFQDQIGTELVDAVFDTAN